MQPTIENVLHYAKGLIGLPYRWYRFGEQITDDDKFYAPSNDAHNDPVPTCDSLFKQNKCIVCTGVPNLMRRYNGLCVPPPYGTTDAWFHYLQTRGWLEPFDIQTAALYPHGTLVLRDFTSLEHDQGHVAVIVDEMKILHAYADIPYTQSAPDENVGVCNITDLMYSHYYDGHPGYYTHVCRPEHWLLKN